MSADDRSAPDATPFSFVALWCTLKAAVGAAKTAAEELSTLRRQREDELEVARAALAQAEAAYTSASEAERTARHGITVLERTLVAVSQELNAAYGCWGRW